jgi:hypothetical protein
MPGLASAAELAAMVFVAELAAMAYAGALPSALASAAGTRARQW